MVITSYKEVRKIGNKVCNKKRKKEKDGKTNKNAGRIRRKEGHKRI